MRARVVEDCYLRVLSEGKWFGLLLCQTLVLYVCVRCCWVLRIVAQVSCVSALHCDL